MTRESATSKGKISKGLLLLIVCCMAHLKVQHDLDLGHPGKARIINDSHVAFKGRGQLVRIS